MKENFILHNIDGIWFGISPKLEQKGIKHAFTTKWHGKSIVLPDTLNMSLHVNDDVALIAQNRKAVCEALQLDFAKLTTPQQVHGTNSVYVDSSLCGCGRDDFDDAIADTDALFTDIEGIPLMLLFADCTPVIIADPLKKVVAVVHAGWRGTVQKIIEKTIRSMSEQLGVNPADCLAMVGPSMGPCCYQVGQEVYHCAKENLPDFEKLFRLQSEGQWLFDLWQANKNQLLTAGLYEENIVVSGICTQCNQELFFSHRADHGKTGRFAAIIWL